MIGDNISGLTWFFIIALLVTLLIIYNVAEFAEKPNKEAIVELPAPPAKPLPDPSEKMDDGWRVKVEKQRQEEKEGKEEQFWRADIKRESHSMREGAKIFIKINHQIEKERREAERQERIRIQKEKAAERKRLREERLAEKKRLAEEKKARKHAKISQSTR